MAKLTDDQAQIFDQIRPAISNLMKNFGKNANTGLIDSWATTAVEDGYTPSEIEAAVARCIREWPDRIGPQGWAAFAKHVKRKTTAPKAKEMPWYSELFGDWGGDWIDVPVQRWLEVAAMFTANMPFLTDRHKPLAEEFLAFARKRVSRDDIERAAEAYKSKALSRFVSQWLDGRKKSDVAQEALEV